ncbi:MAG TPA: hypothetical protein VHO03_17080 [Ignavibacteriales bacterium]|nr:hypothetical protein [Ignavibacteriales bacterium]
MQNDLRYEKPAPFEIPDDIIDLVKEIVDAHNEKRIVSVQTRRPADPGDRQRKIEIIILDKNKQ